MILVVISLLTAFVISYFSIPAIIRIATEKNLFDEPNERSSHSKKIPSLGGLGIFIGFVFSVFFWVPDQFLPDLKYLLCAMMILVPVGLKDDISPISPVKKLVGQLLTIVVLVFFADLRIENLFGVLGIYEISAFFSYPFSIVVILTIINGFNLIDGINGLAAGITLLSSLLFGVWFYLVEYPQFAMIAFGLFGAVIGFICYNITPAKIFLGDTGSMLLGLVCAFLCIRFINVHTWIPDHFFAFEKVPAIAISIFILPLFDTIRVFVIRMLNGKSPIEADRNHIHHILIDSGLKHISATLTLLFVNILFIVLAISLKSLDGFTVIGLMLGLALILTGFAVLYRNNYQMNRVKKGDFRDPQLRLKGNGG